MKTAWALAVLGCSSTLGHRRRLKSVVKRHPAGPAAPRTATAFADKHEDCARLNLHPGLVVRGGASCGEDIIKSALWIRGGSSGGTEDYTNDDWYYGQEAEEGYRDGSPSASSYDPRYDSQRDDFSSSGYYDDEGRWHDDYDRRSRSRTSSASRSATRSTKLPTVLTASNKKVGIILLSAGAAFTALGMTLFFNKTLMRLGNLLFVAGVPLMIGPGRTMGYFLQPQKARATGCLACGILLVLVGHPVIGILLEVFGLLNLFGNMFPLVMMMAKNLPVVGNLFSGKNSGGGTSRRDEDPDRGYRYEDERRDRDYEGYDYDDRRY